MLSVNYIKLTVSVVSSTLWFIISCFSTSFTPSVTLLQSSLSAYVFLTEKIEGNRRKSPLVPPLHLLPYLHLQPGSLSSLLLLWVNDSQPIHCTLDALSYLPKCIVPTTLFTPSIINPFFSLGLFLACEQTVYSSLKTKHISKIPLKTALLLIDMSTSLLVEGIV